MEWCLAFAKSYFSRQKNITNFRKSRAQKLCRLSWLLIVPEINLTYVFRQRPDINAVCPIRLYDYLKQTCISFYLDMVILDLLILSWSHSSRMKWDLHYFATWNRYSERVCFSSIITWENVQHGWMMIIAGVSWIDLSDRTPFCAFWKSMSWIWRGFEWEIPNDASAADRCQKSWSAASFEVSVVTINWGLCIAVWVLETCTSTKEHTQKTKNLQSEREVTD